METVTNLMQNTTLDTSVEEQTRKLQCQGLTAENNFSLIAVEMNAGLSGNSRMLRYDEDSQTWQQFSEIPLNHYGNAFVHMGNNLIFIGGYNSGVERTNIVEQYNLAQEEWQPLPALSYLVRDANAVVLNDNIYVLGGFDYEERYDTVQMFDFKIGQWKDVAKMITPRSNAAVTVFDGKIYVFGGWSDLVTGLKECECYDPEANTWTKLPDMSVERGDAGAVVAGGFIYVIGGCNGPTLSTVERYDPVNNTWTMIKDLNTPRRYVCGFYQQQRLYAIGGETYGRGVESIEEYDFENETWILHNKMHVPFVCRIFSLPTDIAAKLERSYIKSKTLAADQGVVLTENDALLALELNKNPTKASTILLYNAPEDNWQQIGEIATKYFGYELVCLGNSVFFIGGYNEKSESTNAVEKYNLEMSTWETLPALPQRLRGINVALLNESIYVLGGYVHNAAEPVDTVYRLDNAGTAWQRVANLLQPRFEANVTVFEDKIYVFGGFSAESTPLAESECYDPVSNIWVQCADMLEPRGNVGLTIAKGQIYVLGGTKNPAGVGVQCYDPFKNVWTKICPLNVERNSTCGLYLNGRILAIGGLQDSKGVETIESYCATIERWGVTKSLPRGGCYRTFRITKEAAIALTQNLAALTNACRETINNTKTNSNGESSQLVAVQMNRSLSGSSVLLRYVEFEDKWRVFGEIPTKQYGFKTVFVNNSLIFIGGYDNNLSNTSTVNKFNLETLTWEALPSLPQPVRDVSTLLCENKIYVFGGFDDNSCEPFSNVQVFDLDSGKWNSAADMPTPRYGSSVVAFDGKIYVFGGWSDCFNPLKICESYDPKTDTWTQCADMFTNRADAGITIVKDYIYIVGGCDGPELCSVERYDPWKNEWTELCSLNIPRTDVYALNYNNRLFAIGGLINSCGVDIIEEYDFEHNKWELHIALPVRAAFDIFNLSGKCLDEIESIWLHGRQTQRK